MAELAGSHVAAKHAGGGSSVDGNQQTSRGADGGGDKLDHHRVSFPSIWKHHCDERRHLDYLKGSLKKFYELELGMQRLFEELGKYFAKVSPTPQYLQVTSLEDKNYDERAGTMFRTCSLKFTEEQKEGLQSNDKDTVAALLLTTMVCCKELKTKAITRCEDIKSMQDRFHLLSLKELQDLESAGSDRNNVFHKDFKEWLQAEFTTTQLQSNVEDMCIELWKQSAQFDNIKEDMERRMEAVEKTNKELDRSLADISKRNKENSDKRSELEQKLKKTENSLKTSQNVVKKQQQEIRDLKSEMEKKEKTVLEKERRITEYASTNANIQMDRANLTNRAESLETTLKRLKENETELKSALAVYENELKVKKEEMTRLKREMEHWKFTAQSKDREISELTAAKESLLTRLSKVAGAKLTHENANITDLSDPNRPTKVSEKFSELYDNEWTDALEELSALKVIEEKQALDYLRNILMKSFHLCCKASRKLADTVQGDLISLPIMDDADMKDKHGSEAVMLSLDHQTKVEVDRIRKRLSPQMFELVQKRFRRMVENYLENIQMEEQDVREQKKDDANICQRNGQTEEPMEEDNEEDSANPDESKDRRENEEKHIPPQKPSLTFDSKSDLSESMISPTASKECTPCPTNFSKSLNSKVPQAVLEGTDFTKAVQFRQNLPTDEKHPNDTEKNEDAEDKSKAECWTLIDQKHGGGENDVEMTEYTHEKDMTSTSSQQSGDGESNPTKQKAASSNSDLGESKVKDGADTAADDKGNNTNRENEKQSFEERFGKVFKYSKKCVHLSWLMRNHSPELHLDDSPEEGSKFDHERFKEYTKTGDIMDYVVWPALYLHEGGPLLAKGVAQPRKKQ